MFDELYIIASFLPIHRHLRVSSVIAHPALMSIEMFAYDGDAVEKMPSRAYEIISAIPTLEKYDIIPCRIALNRLLSSSYKMGVFSWTTYKHGTCAQRYIDVIEKISPGIIGKIPPNIDLFQKNWLMSKSDLPSSIPVPDEFPADARCVIDVIRNDRPCADKIIDILFVMDIDTATIIIDSYPREMKRVAQRATNRKRMIDLANRVQRRGWYISAP